MCASDPWPAGHSPGWQPGRLSPSPGRVPGMSKSVWVCLLGAQCPTVPCVCLLGAQCPSVPCVTHDPSLGPEVE